MASVVAVVGAIISSTAIAWTTVALAVLEVVSVASLFMAKSVDYDSSANSPTYSFGPLGNTKTQMLPIPIIYGGPIRVAGNVFYEKYIDAEKKYNAPLYWNIRRTNSFHYTSVCK